MDDLFLFIIFIIISIVSYFNKKKESDPEDSHEWPEQANPNENKFEFETLQNVKPFEPYNDDELITEEQKQIPIASDIINEKMYLKSSVHHHEDKSVESKLKSGLQENAENDAYALKIRTQTGQKDSKKKVHSLVNKLSKNELKHIILLKEVLDRPRAFDI